MKQYSGKKRQIQSYFYKKSPTRSNVVALAGNNLDLHIKDFNNILTSQSKAYIYDLDINVIRRFKYLESKQILLINDNIFNSRIERFMDIDLMQTLTTIHPIITHLLLKQYRKHKYNDKYKTFMFTYAHRGNKYNIEEYIKYIKSLIDINIINFEYILYKDTSCMYTVQIIWK